MRNVVDDQKSPECWLWCINSVKHLRLSEVSGEWKTSVIRHSSLFSDAHSDDDQWIKIKLNIQKQTHEIRNYANNYKCSVFNTFQLNRRFYRVTHASETNRDCVICVVQKMTNRCLCARLLMSPCVSKICC